MPGPYTLLVPLKVGGGYRDKDTLLADLVGIVNAECRALVEAGADFIQIDEPHSGMYPGAPPRFDHGVNRAVEGIDAKIAVHVCFGNLYGRPCSPYFFSITGLITGSSASPISRYRLAICSTGILAAATASLNALTIRERITSMNSSTVKS